MPNFAEILKKITINSEHEKNTNKIRQEYLLKLHKYTRRNVISYYSGWLQKPQIEGVQINDDYMNGFMMSVHGLDCSKGLDLILHTPGGGVAATESIVDYLHRKFHKNIRVIVPQLAMSAGTMIACSAREIFLGKQSSLGPIDPQLKGVPAYGVVHEFEEAHKEIKKDQSALAVWQFILNKYHPTFLSECKNAISLAKEMVKRTLVEVMFEDDKSRIKKAEKIVKYLSDYLKRKTHSRHVNIDKCKEIGLRILALEEDQELQDLVLTIHHCYTYTLANSPVFKIIENHKGAAYVRERRCVPLEPIQ